MNKIGGNKLINFLIVSMGIIFLLQWIPALRVPLIVLHITFLFLSNWKKAKFDTISILLIIIFLYSVIQGMYIQKNLSLLKFLQSIVIMILYIMYSLYSNAIAPTIKAKHLTSLSTFILVLFGLFLVSFNEWNLTRSAGLMGNPNITAHNLVMILPFSLFIKRNKRFYLILSVLVIYGLISFGSRSAALALGLGLLGFLYFNRIQASNKKSFLIICYIFLSVFLSYKAIEVFKYFATEFNITPNSADSHLFYMGYNGRDILKDRALKDFNEGNVWFGAGFEGGKIKSETEDTVLGVHDGFIELLVRLGYIGSFLFIVLMICFVKFILKIKNKRNQSVAIMSLVCLLSLSTNSSTFFVLNYYYFFFVLTFSIAYYSNYKRYDNATIKM
ncbi:O-antigen ligase family protein [Vaginella massiliensis]|uniref:O-antigen ligase family protein n=1 Tax=Vaginella massiliensis TaxID=1816680 RepID=UPI0012B625C4|nr:hypothetical protein [Vaginella massiliensis]